MLLKRSIVLAAGVLLFIAAFITYFNVSRAQMEERFLKERENFHVQGVILTGSEPSNLTAHASAATAPDSSPGALPDTNTLIGPVPPPSSSAPDSTEAPAFPAAPDTNSAPAPSAAPAPPDSN